MTEIIIADYNASKAANVSLHESLRYELDKRCVRRSQTTKRHLTSNTCGLVITHPRFVLVLSYQATS